MRIGVIGGGIVGRATARAWLEHCDEVRVHDRVKERSTHRIEHAMQCDLVFVCLPSEEVEDCLGVSPSALRDANYVLKSTVPIGFTRKLAADYGLTNLVHSPEFLTARCAVEDAQNPAQVVVGTTTGWAGDAKVYVEACKKRFPGVNAHVVTYEESEVVKLFLNAAFAVKVSLFNELRSLSDKLKLDWDAVLHCMLADGRVGRSHTTVPGPDGKRGFGGACLPKDIVALAHQFVDAGLYARILSAAIERNSEDRCEND